MRAFQREVVFAVAVALARAAAGVEPPSTLELAQAPNEESRSALAELIARAQALSQSGKPAEAYELLLSQEDSYIGTIEFDYALGRAALDAGHPDKATLAFSRVLALEPGHAGASIDMGRAYLALGDNARARSTFERLLALDPPPAIRAQLQAFLDIANAPTPPPPTGRSFSQGYLGALLGYSSNVNQAPSQSVIFVPGVGSNFELPGQNVKKPDSFAGLLGGIDFSRALNETYSLTFGGEFLGRRNFHESDFNVAGLGAYLGLSAVKGPHAATIQALAARDYLGGTANRNLESLTLGYAGTVSPATQLVATAQGGRQRFVPGDFRIFDADFIVLGAGGAHKVGERSNLFALVSTGYQNDVGGNPSGNRDLLGIQLGGETVIGSRIKATAAAVGERSRYDKFDTGFQTERRDLRRAFEAGAQYFLDRDWSLRLLVSYAFTRSNIPIYEYTRTEGMVMLRRDFR
jgi:tetratricopeptide (TPR) repeat protein